MSALREGFPRATVVAGVGAGFATPLALSSLNGAGFATPLPLSSLDGSNGFPIEGIDVGDYSGWSVSSAGDINGDGFDDLIVGAFLAESNGQPNAGTSYVVFGGF